MKRTVTQLGKVGNVVWGRNRYGQTCYELVIPANPRTPAQQAKRGQFGAVSSQWRGLTQEQRDQWEAAGARHPSRRRLGQSGPLSGFSYFVKVNVVRANRGLPLRETPPASRGRHASAPKPKPGLPVRAALGQPVPCPAGERSEQGRRSWRSRQPGLRTGARGGGDGGMAGCYGGGAVVLRYPKRLGTVWGTGCPGSGRVWGGAFIPLLEETVLRKLGPPHGPATCADTPLPLPGEPPATNH